MKKMEVSDVLYGTLLTRISFKESVIGKENPNAHPLRVYKEWFVRSSVDGIRIGDIVRCDGLPFQSRPAPIVKLTETGRTPLIYSKTKGRFVHHYTHRPFRLKLGLWVLRPVVVVDESKKYAGDM